MYSIGPPFLEKSEITQHSILPSIRSPFYRLSIIKDEIYLILIKTKRKHSLYPLLHKWLGYRDTVHGYKRHVGSLEEIVILE